jgi:hypothetical protein
VEGKKLASDERENLAIAGIASASIAIATTILRVLMV